MQGFRARYARRRGAQTCALQSLAVESTPGKCESTMRPHPPIALEDTGDLERVDEFINAMLLYCESYFDRTADR